MANGSKSLGELTTAYFDRRMASILLIGSMSGFPWALIGSALSLWLKEEGFSRTDVGLFGLLFAVYAFNYLWAPLVDRIPVPFLSERFGARRGWIFLLQAIIILATLGWYLVSPTNNVVMVAVLGFAIALASATQDIAIDALRIEQFSVDEREKMAAGAAMAVAGWWTGFKLGGAAVLWMSEIFQEQGYADYWQMAFLGMAIMMVIMNVGVLFIADTSKASVGQAEDEAAIRERLQGKGWSEGSARIVAWISTTVLVPFVSFFRKNGVSVALALLGFIFLFKVGEAFLGKMTILFYKEIGFSKSDIALYSKTLGWIVTIVFTLFGGLLTVYWGLLRALIVSGVLMAGTNLLFALLDTVGPSGGLFALVVVLDDLAAAFASVTFVAFISLLVDRSYTATQYALLASIGTASRTVLAASSGALVDWLQGDWTLFFLLTTLMVIPSFIFLALVWGKLDASIRTTRVSLFSK